MTILSRIDIDYSAPRVLSVNDALPKRVLVIGSCYVENLASAITLSKHATQCDFLNINYGGFLPSEPPRPLSEYDLIVIQIPLRTLIPEIRLMRLSFDDQAGYAAIFEDAVRILKMSIDNALAWSDAHSIPALVCNFPLPQQNPFGRLMPRYDLRNPTFVLEELNRALASALSAHKSAHLLDTDQLAAIHGRRFTQDDSFMIFSHGATITGYDDEHDQGRIEKPTPSLVARYEAKTDVYLEAVWQEIVAIYRTLLQVDQVKLVVVDLDDTLWRGVMAEGNPIEPHLTEGWPLGFAEALLYLKKRGVLLAVASKNDDVRIRAIWHDIFGGRLVPEDFSAWKVNWNPKPINMAEILADLSLLPRSVVFIDDNPVERARMAEAFPDMRILGADPHSFRRVLLWAPETQVAQISKESLRRTEMIQSQVLRESARKAMSEADFLASLSPKVTLFEIAGFENPKTLRVIELLNKTNQFTTTPKRWTLADMSVHICAGGRLFGFEVEDRYTNYGIVGAVVTTDAVVDQFAMSCRVLGLQVESAALHLLIPKIANGGPVVGKMVRTDANGPVRDLWTKAGFDANGDDYLLEAGGAVELPKHIVAAVDDDAAAAYAQ